MTSTGGLKIKSVQTWIRKISIYFFFLLLFDTLHQYFKKLHKCTVLIEMSLYGVHLTVNSVQWTVYSEKCTLYTKVFRALYTGQDDWTCKLCSSHKAKLR